MIFFVRSLGCLIYPSKSTLNYSCVGQCPLQYIAWPHSHGAIEAPCFVSLSSLSVLVFRTELRTVLLILIVWRGLQIIQLVTTQLSSVSVTVFPFDGIIVPSTPVENTFIIFSSLNMDDNFQTIQKKNCLNL
jgi:hypothetical protein